MPLSDIVVRKAKPRPKAFKIADSGGLFLLVAPNGTKCWRYKYRFGGKEKLLAIGTYPEISLATARDSHFEARKLLASGKDPSQVKRESKRQLKLKGKDTFEVIGREWHESQLLKWSPLHAKKILKSLEADVFPTLGHLGITDIPASELLIAIRKIESRGALVTARTVLQRVSEVFRYAIVTDRAERNPATDLRGALKPARVKNNAYLREDDLPEYLKKLANYEGEPITKKALEVLLLTFVRTSEERGAKWKEINYEKQLWRIPPERMKMREPHIVPLSKQAIKKLRELEKLTGNTEFLFPNQKNFTRCMSENTMLYALYRMGYHSRATGHGFRATASTILNEHGFNSDVIERQLAHAERDGVRASYNHAEYLPQRRKMMQWWANYLERMAKRKN